MLANKVMRHCSVALVAIFCGALYSAPVAGASDSWQGESAHEVDGLKLVAHEDGTYQLSADRVSLRQLVAGLARASGVEFSLSSELDDVAVTLETDRVPLGELLTQLRAAARVNLIMATTRAHVVSRVWLTAVTSPAASTVGVAAAPPPRASPLPTSTPEAGVLPVQRGNELRAVGYDPSVDMASVIRDAAARDSATQPTSGATGGGSAGMEQGAGATTGESEEVNGPPLPIDPNALEKYFAGDSSTKTYHRLNCIQAMYLPSVNKVWFTSRQEAIAAGYKPHEVCVGR